MTRVFVARLEILTPEREQWIREQLQRQDRGEEAASADLARLGRFVSAAIQHVRVMAAPHG